MTSQGRIRRIAKVIAITTSLLLVMPVYAWLEARRDPVVRTATVRLADWPLAMRPMRVALISDVHIGTIAMDQGRLARIVEQINSLNPDLVLIAGDFIFGHQPGSAARLGAPMVGPLARLRSKFGTVAALGNHDYWTGPASVRAQLKRAGVVVVENEAVRRGPLAIGVVSDDFTHRADVPRTIAAVRKLQGARIVLSHSPDIVSELPNDVGLLLAGHTHCGQVVLPLYGSIVSVSRYGERYRCGLVSERHRTVVVTAGLGTSGASVRIGAPPDLWLLTLAGRPRS